MALSLNLLHEQQKRERQRQLDPLKLGIYLICGIVACFVAYYLFSWFSAQSVLSKRDDLRAQWQKRDKELAAVSKAEVEMKATAGMSSALGYRIENRFYWGPVLELLYKAVPAEVQIMSFTGGNIRTADFVTIALEGVAAGAEPRAAAEKFRAALIAAFGTTFKDVAVTFRTLEESGAIVKVKDKDLPTARFTVEVRLRKPVPPTPVPTPVPVVRPAKPR